MIRCFLLILFSALTLSACQTTPGTGGTQNSQDANGVPDINLSLEEIQNLEIEFGDLDFEMPKRSIEDVKQNFSDQPLTAYNCTTDTFYDKYQKKDLTGLSDYLFKRGVWSQVQDANYSLFHGDISHALILLNHANDSYPTSWNLGRSTSAYTTSMYYAIAGDTQNAIDQFSKANGLIHKSTCAKCRKGKKIYRENRDLFDQHTNGARASMAYSEGRYRDAELLFKQILGKTVRGSKVPIRIISYYIIQSIMKQGRLGEAEAMARRRVMFLKNVSIDGVWFLDVFAQILLTQGRNTEALWASQKAMEFFESRCASVDLFIVQRAYLRLAEAHAANGQWPEVVEIYNKLSSELAKINDQSIDQKLMSTPDWGMALLATGQLKEASRIFETTSQIINEQYGSSSYELAEVQSLTNLTAIKLSGQGDLSTLTTAIDSLIERSDQLSATFKQSSAYNNRLSLLVNGYLDLVANNQNLDDATLSATLRYAQLGRGGKVQAALASSALRTAVDDPQLQSIARKHQDVGNRITELRGAIAFHSTQTSVQESIDLLPILKQQQGTLKAAYNTLNVTIARDYPKYNQLISEHQSDLAEVRASLKPDESVLYYRLAEETGYVWAIKSSGPVSFSKIDHGKQSIQTMVSELREAVDPKTMRSLKDVPAYDVVLANKLYDILMQPVEEGWTTAKNLIVVGDGALKQLPFSMLVKTAQAQPTDTDLMFAGYKDIDWLANSHAVTMLPALRSLSGLRAFVASPAPKPFIGFGDPYFNVIQAAEAAQESQNIQVASADADQTRSVNMRGSVDTRALDSATLARIPRLPDTANELREIAISLGADPNADVYLGLDATEEQVKSMDLSQYRVVAFATHGLVAVDLDGLYQPALALSNPKLTKGDGDGLLMLGEILGLSLKADWVVLSACNTAAADGEGAEAVSGLGQAFFHAGTRALLVSNWPVHSTATRVLTTTLFKNQSQDATLTRAEALRQARLHLINTATFKTASGKTLFSYAHPIFWVPFTIVGDGGV